MFNKKLSAILIFLIFLFSAPVFAKNAKSYESLKLFSIVLDTIEQEYVDKVDSDKVIRDAIKGMISGLDPHSAFLLPDELKELEIDTSSGEFSGVGIEISQRGRAVVVISAIAGTPAYNAGIISGDQIVKIDGEHVKNVREVAKRVRGTKGKKVKITILRKGEPDPLVFDIIRDFIPIISVKWAVLKPNYGYIRITNFRDNTFAELEKALNEIEKSDSPLKGLVLDLRNNPGGLLPQALKVSDAFLEKGRIVFIKGRGNRYLEHYKAHPNKIKRKYPIVVLINEGSASASEIVAGALQDNKRALILGTGSFGKGSVQKIIGLEKGCGLKLTIARYYTPNGRTIQAKGIEPDIIVEKVNLKDKLADAKKHIKEKDLRNHLSSMPYSKKIKNVKKDKESKPGEPETAKLLADNQISEALHILTAHTLLK